LEFFDWGRKTPISNLEDYPTVLGKFPYTVLLDAYEKGQSSEGDYRGFYGRSSKGTFGNAEQKNIRRLPGLLYYAGFTRHWLKVIRITKYPFG